MWDSCWNLRPHCCVCVFCDTVSQSIAVEFLARVPANIRSSSWLVDIYNRTKEGGWESIGDFSAAVPTWSPVSLTISGHYLNDYIDYEGSNDILVRVYTDTNVTDTEQVRTSFICGRRGELIRPNMFQGQNGRRSRKGHWVCNMTHTL